MERPAQTSLDLDDAGARIVTPLPCDRWLASSALQKAIRRGDVVTAQRSAVTLSRYDRSATWRRLLVIAAEDVGVGSIEAVSEVARLASDPDARRQRGGDEASLLHACRLLADALKDRTTDLLIIAAMYSPELEETRAACGQSPIGQRLAFVADASRTLPQRAVAAWYASGLDSWPERRVGLGDFAGLMRVYMDLGVPAAMIEAVRISARRTREPITILLPLIWLHVKGRRAIEVDVDLRGSCQINGVPFYALDGHTRLGRQAISILMKTNPKIAEFLCAQVADFKADRALRIAVDYADSVLSRRRLAWDGLRQIEALGIAADFLGVRVQPEIGNRLIALVCDNIDHLDAIRADLLVKALQAET